MVKKPSIGSCQQLFNHNGYEQEKLSPATMRAMTKLIELKLHGHWSPRSGDVQGYTS